MTGQLSVTPAGLSNSPSLGLKSYLGQIINEKMRFSHSFGMPKKYNHSDRMATISLQSMGNIFWLVPDVNGTMYVSFMFQNRIEKYSPDGKLLFSTDRPLPFEEKYSVSYNVQTIRGKKFKIPFTHFPIISTGIFIDQHNNFWVNSAIKKLPSGEELDKMKKEGTVKVDDYYHFEIFNSDGILLGYLPYPAHELTGRPKPVNICGDQLFFSDLHEEACIYQFKIVYQQ